MAYRFKLNRHPAREIRRIGLTQIDLALTRLSLAEQQHKSVHQARKGFKRLRSLLRLARFTIDKQAFKQQNSGFRDISHMLAGARDKQAMIECVTKLQIRFGLDWNVPAVTGIKSWLYEQRRHAERELSADVRPNAVAALTNARASYAEMEISGDLDDLMAGLQDCYERGRRTRKRAYAHDVDEDFHEWRKWVQQHWRHMQLLSRAWPEVMHVRVEAARELSEFLGDDHDLYFLAKLVRENGPGLADEKEVARFLEGCRLRQQELRALARHRGARLFGESAKSFRQRITAYWKESQKIERDDRDAAGDGVSRDLKTNRLML